MDFIRKIGKSIFIREQLGIVSIDGKIRRSYLRWYEHMPTRFIGIVDKDLNILNLNKNINFA